MYKRTIVNPMSFGRTKVDPLKVGELLSILWVLGELGRPLEGRRAFVDPTMYKRTTVNPMSFGRTKVDPLKLGELLSILRYIGELLSILWVLGELRSIP